MAFVTVLLVLSVIDLLHYVLPDVLTIPGIAVGVALTWLPGWPVSLVDASLSAGVGYVLMMSLARAAEWYYGEEAIGRGDWKMVAMLGANLGSAKLLGVALVANASGAVIGIGMMAVLGQAGRRKLPLGTFLGAGGIAAALI
jgi:leader peptidase (prepilin peptidase)/N-methyltransferase